MYEVYKACPVKSAKAVQSSLKGWVNLALILFWLGFTKYKMVIGNL